MLHLQTGAMLALDGALAQLWCALPDAHSAGPSIAPAPELLSELASRGLLSDDAPASAVQAAPASRVSQGMARGWLPAWPHALWARRRVRRAAQSAGFAGMLAQARRAAGIRGEQASQRRLGRVLGAYRRAEGWVGFAKGTDDCLPRAFALFVFLRERGIAARHVIALRPRPFAAHAYVEVGGVPVLENPRELEGFRPLSTLEDPDVP